MQKVVGLNGASRTEQERCASNGTLGLGQVLVEIGERRYININGMQERLKPLSGNLAAGPKAGDAKSAATF